MATKSQQNIQIKLDSFFANLSKDSLLTKEFLQDPEKVLINSGIDPTKVTIQKSSVKKPSTGPATSNVTICASVGVIVCGTIGADSDTILKPIKIPKPPRRN